jgi:hypothetical protein
MKKILLPILALALVFMATQFVAQGMVDRPPKGAHYDVNFVTKLSYTELLFSDLFDGDLSQWQQISGSWGIVQDVFPENTNYVCSITGGSYVGGLVLTAGSENWTNYTLEFKVKKVSGNYFNVVFRYTDIGNHYLLEPSYDEVHVALFKKVGGGGYQELTATRPLQDTEQGTWYHYRIVLQGPSIKIYVDGILIFDVLDNSLPTGKIGIGAYSGSTAYFDNIRVMGVNPKEILVAFNGSVAGLRYVGGDTFAILDNDGGVFDGDAAVLQLPCYDIYDVYCSARGRPGGAIIWGSSHTRIDVPAGKPTWHQHNPDNFSLSNYGSGCYLGPYPVTTSNDATILATRWYPQN